MKPDPLDRATSLLTRAVADTGDVDAATPGRDEAVAQIAEALRQRRAARQRRRRFTYFAAAATLLLAVGFAARRPTSPVVETGARVSSSKLGLVVMRDGRESTVALGDRVLDGAELRTPANGETSLDFERGSRLSIASSSRVRLVEQARHKHFALVAGSLRAKVAKLTPDERFVVSTSDTEVEVRGTEFHVSLVPSDPSCGEGTPTRVDVTEGVVVVRNAGVEHRVAAGEHWPDCAPAAPTPSSSTAVMIVKPVRSELHPHALAPAANASSQEIATSRLAEQNDLFSEAMRRKRAGDANGALESLDRLLAKYADGPLAESAEVERMHILAGVDRTRAAGAARDYLRTHPKGYARAEAESIASGP